MRSFVKIKSSRNGEITPFTDIDKSCPSRDFYVANMSFNTLLKISRKLPNDSYFRRGSGVSLFNKQY